MTNRLNRIRERLTQEFAPEHLEIEDQSARHAGHAGASPAGETHYLVQITSPKFAGMSRVDMQRAINNALEKEFETGLHALSIKARASVG